MKEVLFFALTLFVTSASAQNEITYPYNPDSNENGLVDVSDVLSTISVFGTEFTPEEIQIDGVNLAEFILELGVSCIPQDQSGIDLSGIDLAYAVFLSANLTGADFTGANLTNAFFNIANLTGADFYHANLTDASLWDANLTGADLIGADLTGAILTLANLTGANLTNADLTGANLSGVTWTGAYINGCTGCDCIDADGDNYCD